MALMMQLHARAGMAVINFGRTSELRQITGRNSVASWHGWYVGLC